MTSSAWAVDAVSCKSVRAGSQIKDLLMECPGYGNATSRAMNLDQDAVRQVACKRHLRVGGSVASAFIEPHRQPSSRDRRRVPSFRSSSSAANDDLNSRTALRRPASVGPGRAEHHQGPEDQQDFRPSIPIIQRTNHEFITSRPEACQGVPAAMTFRRQGEAVANRI